LIIYKTTNLINNKIYIGKSKFNNSSYFGSGTILKKAINKYGKNNFKKEIIIEFYFYDEQLLNESEIYYIEFNKSTSVDIGYNIKKGGDGGGLPIGFKFTEESKKKMSESQKNLPKDIRERISKLNSESKIGKKASIETRNKMSAKHKGNNNSMFGKKMTLESRIKMSSSASKRIRCPLSEEHKNKLSLIKKGNVIISEYQKKLLSERSKGNKNPARIKKFKKELYIFMSAF